MNCRSIIFTINNFVATGFKSHIKYQLALVYIYIYIFVVVVVRIKIVL